jgi:hypothetical protein
VHPGNCLLVARIISKKPTKNPMQKLHKNSPKTPQKSSSQKSAKNLSQKINKNILNNSKNFIILPKTLKL